MLYKSLENLNVSVFRHDDEVAKNSMTYRKVVECINEALVKMDDSNDLMERYFEELKINPRSSFAWEIEYQIFEKLFLTKFNALRLMTVLSIHIDTVERGNIGTDNVMVTLD